MQFQPAKKLTNAFLNFMKSKEYNQQIPLKQFQPVTFKAVFSQLKM